MSDWAGLSLESAHWCLTELCTELILKSERAQQTETCQNGHVSVVSPVYWEGVDTSLCSGTSSILLLLALEDFKILKDRGHGHK